MGAAVLPVGLFLSKGAEAIAGLSEGRAQADALRAKAQYEKGILESNKRLAEIAASDAISRGESGARDTMREERRIQGAQQASYAAGGVDVGSRTVSDVGRETALNAAIDIATIRSNARREALGYKMQALDYQKAADFGVSAAEKAASQTLLTSGLRAFSRVGEGAYGLYRSGLFEKTGVGPSRSLPVNKRSMLRS